MDNNIILLIMASVLLVSFLIICLVMLSSLDRNRRIKELRTNLSYFPPEKLVHRIQAYEKEMEHKGEFQKIQASVNDLAKREFLQIKKSIEELEKYSSPFDIIHSAKFNSIFKEVILKIKSYQKDYLDIRFALFDLTSDIEIEKAVLKKLKDQTSHVTLLITNSPLERINDSKKLEAKVKKLRNKLFELEKMIENENLHLSQGFIDAEEEINKLITSLANDVDFMNHNIKHLEEDLNYATRSITSTYREHQGILKGLKEYASQKAEVITKLREEINIDIDSLKTSDASMKMEQLNQHVNELHKKVHSNIDYASFNHNNDGLIGRILEFVRSNHGMFVAEIKRHRLEDEQRRLLLIQSGVDEFYFSVSKYTQHLSDDIEKNTPEDIHKLLMNVVECYEKYINVTRESVQDISEVNDSTNEINTIIAKMNTSLLQVEYNVISLHGILKSNIEHEKDEIQEKVKHLRELFKNNTDTIDSKTREIVNKIKNRVDQLVEKSRGAAFEFFFIKETIMYINRFKGSDQKLDILIESLVESFDEQNYTEALRKAKEIIEIYGIK